MFFKQKYYYKIYKLDSKNVTIFNFNIFKLINNCCFFFVLQTFALCWYICTIYILQINLIFCTCVVLKICFTRNYTHQLFSIIILQIYNVDGGGAAVGWSVKSVLHGMYAYSCTEKCVLIFDKLPKHHWLIIIQNMCSSINIMVFYAVLWPSVLLYNTYITYGYFVYLL